MRLMRRKLEQGQRQVQEQERWTIVVGVIYWFKICLRTFKVFKKNGLSFMFPFLALLFIFSLVLMIFNFVSSVAPFIYSLI